MEKKRAQGMSLQQRKDDLPEILRRFEQENMQKVAAESIAAISILWHR